MKYIGIVSKTAFIFISAGFFSFLVSLFIDIANSYHSDYIDRLLSGYEEAGIPIPKECYKDPFSDREYRCSYKETAELLKPSIMIQMSDLIEAVYSSCELIIGALSFFLSIIIVYLAMILHRLKKLT